MLTQVVHKDLRCQIWFCHKKGDILQGSFGFEHHIFIQKIFLRSQKFFRHFLPLFYLILYLLVRGPSNSNLSQLNFFVLHPLVRFLSRKNSSFKWIGHSCLSSPYFRLPTCVSHARLNMYDIMHNQSTFRWYHNMLSKKKIQ